MSNTLCIALDLGTTAIKGARLNAQGKLQGIVSSPTPAISVSGTTYESDALAYAAVVDTVLASCIDANKYKLGICSQRSSFLLWDANTGVPVTPLISWQDGRGAQSCMELMPQQDKIHALSGLPLTPYYFAPKLRVLLHQHADYRDALLQGRWKVGTLESFLIWRWTKGLHHVTDVSMAARTQLMDINTLNWSEALCSLFDIPSRILPKILPSAGLDISLGHGLTLSASLADQSAALIASVQTDDCEALVNLGTGGFVVRYSSVASSMPEGYLQTLVYQDKGAIRYLAKEGTLNSIAAALAPYDLERCDLEGLARLDIFSLAEPSGLGAPYFRKDIGQRFSADVSALQEQDIATLLLEAVIFRVARILEDFHQERPLQRVYLSGGLANVKLLQQGIALCATCPVYRLVQAETSLLGAAMLAENIAPGSLRDTELILPEQCHQARLQHKYQAWKAWLDGLLA